MLINKELGQNQIHMCTLINMKPQDKHGPYMIKNETTIGAWIIKTRSQTETWVIRMKSPQEYGL